MKSKFVMILLTTSACFQLLSAQIHDNAKTEVKAIDSLIERKMIQSGIVGIGAALIIDNKVIWSNGYGYSDREKQTPFTPSTVLNIASISKTFTGFCMMKAVEQGKVSLDEDINKYLPFKVSNPYFPNEKITLRHLATHTSGLVDRYPFYDDSTYFYGGSKPESLGDFLKNYFVEGGKHYSRDNFIKSKPGKTRDYSNIGAGLAGYIVECATGQKLNEYARQYIFEPLGMIRSGWSLSEINIENHSKLYEKQEESITEIQFYEGTTYPDGGVRTSVNDLSKFFVCLLNDGKYEQQIVLNQEWAREMTRFQFEKSNKPKNVNIKELNSGLFWATKQDVTRIGHNGSDPGVRTYMLSDLKKEIAVIVFFNTSLPEKEGGVYSEIYRALYQYGVELLRIRTTSR